jgi:hypothetical protein
VPRRARLCSRAEVRNFSEKFYAGTGVSIPFHEYSIADDYNYTNKWMPLGSWHIFNVPVYCGYSFGKKKHHINSELGIVLHYGVQDKQLLFLTSRPFFSVGYEFKGEKFLFGIPVYMGLSEKINGNRIFMRWPGIRLGRKF